MSTASVPLFGLARYRENGSIRLGIVAGDQIRPVSRDELGAADLNDFLATAPAGWQRLEQLAEDGAPRLSLDDVDLAAPVEPRQVLQAGANYREHVIELVAAGLTNNTDRTPEEARTFAAEMMDERAASGEPYFFIGLPAAIAGPRDVLRLPASGTTHDWELELAVVIGREAFQVSREQAHEHIAGYTIVNDVTTRELVFRQDMKEIGTDWYRAKNAPGFLPTGPVLAPPDRVDVDNARISLALNGEIRQDSTTGDLLFDIPALISAASSTMPLLPGDLLLTGSPPGNGQHWKRFLQDGDVMSGSITGLGTQNVPCRKWES